jgi:hypothetical protein
MLCQFAQDFPAFEMGAGGGGAPFASVKSRGDRLL